MPPEASAVAGGPGIRDGWDRLDAPGELAATLTLDAQGRNRLALLNLGGTILGGQLAAHCLSAALEEGDPREPASLHVLFLAAADPARHYRAEVSHLREGRRIAHRQARLLQGDSLLADARVVLRAEADAGSGLQSYPDIMPQVAPPEAMVPRSAAPGADVFDLGMAAGHPFIEIRTPPGYRPGVNGGAGSRPRIWLRVPGSGQLSAHQQHGLLAMVSDFWFTLPIHGQEPGDERPSYIASSLDHAVWFHRRPDCSQWMLVETEGGGVHHGLGMAHARFWSRDGKLVATVVQQAMIRG